MKKVQSRELDRKKFFSDPVLVCTVAFLMTAMLLFVLYPLVYLLVDSIQNEQTGAFTTTVFERVLNMTGFRKAFWNCYPCWLWPSPAPFWVSAISAASPTACSAPAF